jgi:response regulator RpfG family c-di-GMP phosphodiesterase
MTDHRDDLLLEQDDLLFAAEDVAETGTTGDADERWKVVIADDDEEVHSLTRLVLSDFTFEGRALEFISAFSGRETVEVLREHPNTAMLLLDVVMEKDDAGLQTVKVIRDELDNHFVRIVLRTGQPGQAPEQDVVATYDINDYKAKTELTAQKLSTTVTSALRSYRDLRTIERNRQGMETVNVLCRDLYRCARTEDLASRALEGIVELLDDGRDDTGLSCVFTRSVDGRDEVLASFGPDVGPAPSDGDGVDVATVDPGSVRSGTVADIDEGSNDSGYFCVLRSKDGETVRIDVVRDGGLDAQENDLVGVFVANVRTAYDNIMLNREILETQREMIFTLGEVVESRSKETANHVKRVGRMARMLGELAGLDDEDASLLELAAPLHDIGKIGIPDSVLLKPGPFSPEERAVMQCHAAIGNDIFKSSHRALFRVAGTISLQHHEKWDGTGYPNGVAGEDIHIHGRIVAIVDVFDALAHERVYKPAMPIDECVQYLRDQSGLHFDPRLVELFVDHVAEFVAVVDELRDETQRIPVDTDHVLLEV